MKEQSALTDLTDELLDSLHFKRTTMFVSATIFCFVALAAIMLVISVIINAAWYMPYLLFLAICKGASKYYRRVYQWTTSKSKILKD